MRCWETAGYRQPGRKRHSANAAACLIAAGFEVKVAAIRAANGQRDRGRDRQPCRCTRRHGTMTDSCGVRVFVLMLIEMLLLEFPVKLRTENIDRRVIQATHRWRTCSVKCVIIYWSFIQHQMGKAHIEGTIGA